MNPQLWWYVARASGLVAWGLVSVSVIVGLLVSTRLTRGRPTPGWLMDLHRFVAGSAVTFTGVHLAGLLADSYVDFRVVDLLVPFAASWKPFPVALGVVSLYVLVAVETTSVLIRRVPRNVWRWTHIASFPLFWLATFHLLLAGTDAGHPVGRWVVNVVMAVVVFLTLVRILRPRARARTRTPGHRVAADSSTRISPV